MTRDHAISLISIALHEHFKPANPIEVAKSAVSIATALDALGLLPATEPAAAATHHQVSPELFSPPHPTTNSQNDLANQQHFGGVQNPDQSWQRLAAPDTPAGTA